MRVRERVRCNKGNKGWGDVAANQGMQATSRSQKSQGNRLPPRASKEAQPCGHLDISPVAPLSDFLMPKTVKLMNHYFKPLHLWECFTAVRGNEYTPKTDFDTRKEDDHSPGHHLRSLSAFHGFWGGQWMPQCLITCCSA